MKGGSIGADGTGPMRLAAGTGAANEITAQYDLSAIATAYHRRSPLAARLRAANPAPYMACLPWEPSTRAPAAAASGLARRAERGAILSASPELLVELFKYRS